MKVKARLYILAAVVALFAVCLSIAIFFVSVQSEEKYTYSKSVAKVSFTVQKLEYDGLQLNSALRGYFINPNDTKAWDNFTQAVKDMDMDIKELHKPEITAVSQGIEKFHINKLYTDYKQNIESLLAKKQRGEAFSVEDINHNVSVWRPFKINIDKWVKASIAKKAHADEDFADYLHTSNAILVAFTLATAILIFVQFHHVIVA